MDRRVVSFLAVLVLAWMPVTAVLPGAAEQADAPDAAGVTQPPERPAVGTAEPDGERDGAFSLFGEGPSSEEKMADWRGRWKEASRWREIRASGGLFETGTAEPLVLHRFERMEDGVLYFLDNRFVHEFAAEGDPENWTRKTLAQFGRSMPGRAWRIGEAWLIGLDAGDAGDDAGLWIWLDLADFGGPPAYPKLTKRARFHPGDPMRLAVSEDPALILATVWKDGRTNEYIFMPETGWRHVTARVPESFAGIWDSPETAGGAADGEPATFARVQRMGVPGAGGVHALEDGRGTVLVLDREDAIGGDAVWRFAGLEDPIFRWIPSLDGGPVLMAEWRRFDGVRVPVLPDWPADWTGGSSGGAGQFLVDESWLASGRRGVLRIGGETLGAFFLDEVHDIERHDETRFLLLHESWSYPLGGAAYRGRDGLELVFEKDGRTGRIGARDALFFGLHQPGGPHALDVLWRESLPYALQPVGDAAGLAETANRTERVLLWMPEEAERPDDPAFRGDWPDVVLDAMNAQCLGGCGDFTVRTVIRQAGGEWYVLAEQTLYRFNGEEMEPAAEWPVRVVSTAHYEKGGESRSARDFVRIGNDWFVADTYGHRLLKIDGAFRFLQEAFLPFPSDIRPEPDGLAVHGLSGEVRFDRDLRIIGESAPVPVPIEGWTEREVDAQSVYHDAESGWTWVADGGWLVRFHEGVGVWERRYIGMPYNGDTRPVLIPFERDVLVLMDERAALFSRDGGWKDVFEYPRELPPYVYEYPYSGEMSWQADTRREIVYFVRGTEVLALDLARGEHRVLFSQKASTIGPLLLAGGRLVFTLHTGSSYDPETLDNQLVILDPETGQFARYGLEPGLITRAADEKGIILAKRGGRPADGAATGKNAAGDGVADEAAEGANGGEAVGFEYFRLNMKVWLEEVEGADA